MHELHRHVPGVLGPFRGEAPEGCAVGKPAGKGQRRDSERFAEIGHRPDSTLFDA
jgi:hypothetical protein